MTLKTAFLAAALGGMLLFGVACSDDDGDSDLGPLETPSVPRTVLPSPPASDTEDSKDDFVKNVNNQIDKMEERISDIENDSDGLSGDAKEEADQKVDDLKKEVSDLRNRLEDYQNSDDDDSEKIRDDIEDKLNDAGTKIDELADRLGI